MSEQNIRKKILKQLYVGACSRTHLHNECKETFNLKTIGEDRTSDRRFDIPFDKLLTEKCIRKVRPGTLTIGVEGKDRKNWYSVKISEIVGRADKTVEKIGKYAFYEITTKGRNLYENESFELC